MDVWIGDLDQFEKLVAVLRELQDEAIRVALINADIEGQRDEFISGYAYLDEAEQELRWRIQAESHENEIRSSLALRMTSTQRRFGQEYKGDPSAVVAEMDLDDLRAISLNIGSVYSTYGHSGFGLDVTFDRDAGVTVRLESPTSDWILVANEKIKVLLKARRPWYRFLRRSWVVIPLVSIALVVLTLNGVAAIPKGTFDAAASSVIWFLIAAAVGAIQVGCCVLMCRLLPAFELYRLGSRANGARVVGLAGAAIAWVAAILIPLLLGG